MELRKVEALISMPRWSPVTRRAPPFGNQCPSASLSVTQMGRANLLHKMGTASLLMMLS